MVHRLAARPPLRCRCAVAAARRERRAALQALIAGAAQADHRLATAVDQASGQVAGPTPPTALIWALLEAVHEGTLALAPADTVQFCNSRFAHMVALPLEQVVGASFSRLVAAADRPLAVAALAERTSAPRELVCRLTRGNGELFSARLALRELPDLVPGGCCVIVTDLTEQERSEARLQAALSAKAVLLREIHHRVKNNLQVIASLLRMEARSHPDGSWHEQLRESQLRIRAMALVHEQLYAAPDVSRIDAASYLHALASGVVRAYATSAAPVSLICAVDDAVILSVDVAVPLGLIVTELIANCVRHAFPDGRSGQILLDLRQTPGDLSLTVRDNGVGLPASIELVTANSLGLRIVRNLAQQLRGSVRITRSAGTTISIVLPAQLL